MKNRIIALTLCTGMLLLGGCASDTGTTSSPSEPSAGSTSSSVETEAPLEESLRLFEEGSKLAASLHIQLEKAEQKVVQMTTNEDHTIKETPFDAQ